MRVAAVILFGAALSTACSSDREAPLQELARSRAGAVDVVVLSPAAAVSAGRATFTLEFRRSSDAALVDVGSVKANATMPMAGMAPMMGAVAIERNTVPGRYVATTNLSMAGEWRLSVDWNGAAGQGSVTVPFMVN